MLDLPRHGAFGAVQCALKDNRMRRLFHSRHLAVIMGIAIFAILVISAASQYLYWTRFPDAESAPSGAPFVRATPKLLPHTAEAGTTTIEWDTGSRNPGELWIALNGVDFNRQGEGSRGTKDMPYVYPAC
jgi:hypothetical protein